MIMESHLSIAKREAKEKGLVFFPRHETNMAQVIRNAKSLDEAVEYLFGYVTNIRNMYNSEIQELHDKVVSVEVLVEALREIDSLSPIHSVDGWIKEVQLYDGETCGQIVNQFDNEVLIAKIATKALATYDKISEDNIMEKSLSLAKSQLNNYKKLSEVKHDTK